MGATIKSALLSVLVLIAVAEYAGAQTRLPDHWYTSGGIDLGKPDWQDIPESESLVRFTDPQDVKLRKAAKLADRYAEEITLRNNASLTYTRLFGRRQDFGTGGVDQAAAWLRYSVETKFYRDRGIEFSDRYVQKAGELAYITQSSSTDTCFIFRALLGDSVTRDQDIVGGVCYRGRVPGRSAAALEKEMLTILARARFAARSDKSSFTVSFNIPESLTDKAAGSNTQTVAATTQSAMAGRPLSGRDALPYLAGRWTSTDCATSYAEYKFTQPDNLVANYNYVNQRATYENLTGKKTQISFDPTGSLVVYWPELGYKAVLTFHGPDIYEYDGTDKKGINSHRVFQRCG